MQRMEAAGRGVNHWSLALDYPRFMWSRALHNKSLQATPGSPCCLSLLRGRRTGVLSLDLLLYFISFAISAETRTMSMTMPIVARNGISHFLLTTNWARKSSFDVLLRHEIVINTMFLSDSSHNLNCLLHNLVCFFTHKLVVTNGIEPFSVECESTILPIN